MKIPKKVSSFLDFHTNGRGYSDAFLNVL